MIRIRRILFLLALAACGPRPRPAAVAAPESHAPTAIDTEWIASATTVTIADGRTLLLGGATTRAALWDGETLVELAPLPEIRDGGTASLLPDGRVLVVGGVAGSVDDDDARLAERTLLWSLDDGFSFGPPLPTPRQGHTATVLLDGDVLVIGGDDFGAFSDPTASAERYVVAENRWRPAGTLHVARQWHTATLLPDGRVIVVGGQLDSLSSTASIEIWDNLTGTFTELGALATSRQWHEVQVVSPTEIVVRGGAHLSPIREDFQEHRDLHDLEVVQVPPRAPLP